MPSVELALVDLLCTVVESGGIAESYGISGCEETEAGVGVDDTILVEEGELTFYFEDSLDDEHDVGTACVIFVKDEGTRALEDPWEDTFLVFGHLYAFTNDDSVFTDEVNTTNVAIEVDAKTWPIQTSGDLFDMSRFTCTVVSLDEDATIIGKTCEYSECGFGIEVVLGIEGWDVFGGGTKGAYDHFCTDTEGLLDRDVFIG